MRKTMLIASAMALTAAQVGVAQAAPVAPANKVVSSAYRAGTQTQNGSQLHGTSFIVAIFAFAAVVAGIIVVADRNDRPTSP